MRTEQGTNRRQGGQDSGQIGYNEDRTVDKQETMRTERGTNRRQLRQDSGQIGNNEDRTVDK